MLAPTDRALYSECLAAPSGFAFDIGLATTYTLDLETLLVLPFTLATDRPEDPDLLLRDPHALLHAIRETSDRLVVFHHAGAASIPSKPNALFSLLDECVVPALPAGGGGVFHAKIWLLRFVSDTDERPLLRAVVLSRNLTYARTWDTVLCLQGERRGARVRDSYGLRDFVQALPDLARVPLREKQQTILAALGADVAHTRFRPPPSFREPVRFHAIGVGGGFKPKVTGYAKRVLCVSPFLTSSAIDRAASLLPADVDPSNRILISRAGELERVGSDAVDAWDCRAVLESVQVGETADDLEPQEASAASSPMRGLHAKMLCVEDHQSRVQWWIGSANLTHAAWEGLGVELMVELSSTAKHAGIDRFLEDGFAKMLESWVPSQEAADEEDDEGAAKLVDEAVEALVMGEPRLTCTGSGDEWNLALDAVPALPAGVHGKAWPISLRESVHAQGLSTTPTWSKLRTSALTSFVGFDLAAAGPTGKATRRFVLQLRHDPFPEDREAHIVRDVVSSRVGFFRFLRLLLVEATGGLGLLGLNSVDHGGERHEEDGRQGHNALFDEMVLEDLLRILTRTPERLKAVDRLVSDLEATDRGKELIPPEFLELWSTVREVWRAA